MVCVVLLSQLFDTIRESLTRRSKLPVFTKVVPKNQEMALARDPFCSVLQVFAICHVHMP